MSLLMVLTGCGSVGQLPDRGAPTIAAGGSTRLVVADWDDVIAAADLAVSQSQAAFLGRRDDKNASDRCKWFELLTIREETGTLEICRERSGPPAQGQPEPLVIKARIGLAGDSAYERMLLDHLEKRLEQLIGDKAHPIPDPYGYNQ